jgi:uracil-DNA glycosylase family 4
MSERVSSAVCFDVHCRRCPRLADFREASRRIHPGYHGAPVGAFGDEDPRWLIVGLAPGMHGANRTGRPFTGDHAGILLYDTLYRLGVSSAAESIAADDGLRLRGVRITNAVKCLPPANKPTPQEARLCNTFLQAEIAAYSRLRVLVALGRIAHDAILDALGVARASVKFVHGAEHRLGLDNRGGRDLLLVDSYHCSRYNTQTRRLTPAMFSAVLARARELAG